MVMSLLVLLVLLLLLLLLWLRVKLDVVDDDDNDDDGWLMRIPNDSIKRKELSKNSFYQRRQT